MCKDNISHNPHYKWGVISHFPIFYGIFKGIKYLFLPSYSLHGANNENGIQTSVKKNRGKQEYV